MNAQPQPSSAQLRSALEAIASAAQGSLDTAIPLDREWVVNQALEALGWAQMPDPDEYRLPLRAASGMRTPEQVGTIAGTMAVYERDRAAEAVRPVLDCFKRASDGWRGRVSAVILARAYAAIGPVPDYLKHVEGQ